MNEYWPNWFALRADDFSLRVAVTLLHFLWQGCAIGVLVFMANRMLASVSASSRYALHTAALLLLPFCAVVTFAVAELPSNWRAAATDASVATLSASTLDAETATPGYRLGHGVEAAPPLQRTDTAPIQSGHPHHVPPGTEPLWETLAPAIVMLYFLGVGLFLLRLALAMWGGHRLRSASNPIGDPALLEVIAFQTRKVGLRLAPVVHYCERVSVPVVVGVLRPITLLPPSLMTGLAPDQVAAIISHELAHIRRYDLLMNVLQRVIESLLFFHPVVWYISRRMSAERETCCDDLVVSSGHEPMDYAGALLRMAELSSATLSVDAHALAASGDRPSQLEARIQRLMQMNRQSRIRMTYTGTMMIVLLTLTIMGLPAIARGFAGADESQQAEGDATNRVSGQSDTTVDHEASKNRELNPADVQPANSPEESRDLDETPPVKRTVIDIDERPDFVFLVGIVHKTAAEEGAHWEGWLKCRTANKTKRFRSGQTLRIGDLSVEITGIQEKEVSVKIAGVPLTWTHGDSLAKLISRSKDGVTIQRLDGSWWLLSTQLDDEAESFDSGEMVATIEDRTLAIQSRSDRSRSTLLGLRQLDDGRIDFFSDEGDKRVRVLGRFRLLGDQVWIALNDDPDDVNQLAPPEAMPFVPLKGIRYMMLQRIPPGGVAQNQPDQQWEAEEQPSVAVAAGDDMPDQTDSMDEEVQEAIEQYFASTSKRDLGGVQAVLSERVMAIEAGKQYSKAQVLDASKPSEILPPEGNDDWDNISIKSLEVQRSATHPSVAMVSFTLSIPLSDESVAQRKTFLKESPVELDASQRAELREQVKNRAIHNAMFAMLTRQAGKWKIASITVPN